MRATIRIGFVITVLSAACLTGLALETTTQSSAPRTSLGAAGATGAGGSSMSGPTGSGLSTPAGIRPTTQPASQPAPVPGTALGITEATRIKGLSTFCLSPTGNILACDAKDSSIKVISPSDELVATWQLPFAPRAIAALDEDTIFVAGIGRLARLDKAGNVVKDLDLAGVIMPKPPEASLAGTSAPNASGASLAGTSLANASGAASAGANLPKVYVASLAASDKDLFLSVSLRTGFAVYRFDHQLEQPAAIITGLRGCCGQMNLYFGGDRLYVAENARYRVGAYDRDGKVLSSWGQAARDGKDGFGSCCNPMNVCTGPDGLVYTAESRTGVVKRFTPEGLYVDLVGAAPIGAGCVHVAVYVAADGRHVYVADVTGNYIRILGNPQPPTPLPAPTTQPAPTSQPAPPGD